MKLHDLSIRRSIYVGAALALLQLAPAAVMAEESAVVDGAREAGAAVGSGIREAGIAGKEAAVTIGREAAEVGKEVGRTAVKVVETVGEAAKEGSKALVRGIKGEE